MTRSWAQAAPLLLAVFLGAAAEADTLSPEAAQVFTLTDWATGLGEVSDLRFLPDGRAVIVQRTGELVVRQLDGTLTPAGNLSVDAAGEKGLLGVEVDPGFATNGFLYFYWSVPNALGGSDLDRHRVSRFTLVDGALDTTSEVVLVDGLRGPSVQNGGGLAFGPDGRLYAGVGDTGCTTGGAPGQNIGNWFGTCLTNANGKILRLDPNGGAPADNPLVSEPLVTACGAACGVEPDPMVTGGPRDEIFAWGFKDPFRLWFDPQTGHLWAGDVGEVTFEELNVVQAGLHYGAPLREGPEGQDAGTCGVYTPLSGDCVDPVYACRHGAAAGGLDGECNRIVSGMIVDSCTWPSPWRGRFYFGDEVSGDLFALTLDATRTGPATATGARVDVGTIQAGVPVAFRVGADGALYVAVRGTGGTGRIARLAPISPVACPGVDGGTVTPDGGVVPGVDGGAPDGGGGPGPSTDVTPTRPGGSYEPPPREGCGCSSGAQAGSALLVFGLTLLAFRTRRRRSVR